LRGGLSLPKPNGSAAYVHCDGNKKNEKRENEYSLITSKTIFIFTRKEKKNKDERKVAGVNSLKAILKF
jgi:hypothetical protein